jgi:hypothetical protein
MDWQCRRLGCVGVPLPEVTVRIIDPETLEELPKDTDGEVSTSVRTLLFCYWLLSHLHWRSVPRLCSWFLSALMACLTDIRFRVTN